MRRTPCRNTLLGVGEKELLSEQRPGPARSASSSTLYGYSIPMVSEGAVAFVEDTCFEIEVYGEVRPLAGPGDALTLASGRRSRGKVYCGLVGPAFVLNCLPIEATGL